MYEDTAREPDLPSSARFPRRLEHLERLNPTLYVPNQKRIGILFRQVIPGTVTQRQALNTDSHLHYAHQPRALGHYSR